MVDIGPRRSSQAPSTDFYAQAYVAAQSIDGNYSVIYFRTYAINRGNTSSNNQSSGYHQVVIDDFGVGHTHYGNPIMPSGYGTGATRWDDGENVVVYHDAAGYAGGGIDRTVRMGVSYSTQSSNDYGTLSIPRIPKPPLSPTSGGSVDQLAPTSLRYSFAWGGDNGGSGITGYEVQVATDAGFGAVVKTISSSGSPVTITGLGGGITYYLRSRAVNARGAGPWGADASGTTLAGVYTPVGGTWTPCAVYAGVNGVWVPCEVKAGRAGDWVALTT